MPLGCVRDLARSTFGGTIRHDRPVRELRSLHERLGDVLRRVGDRGRYGPLDRTASGASWGLVGGRSLVVWVVRFRGCSLGQVPHQRSDNDGEGDHQAYEPSLVGLASAGLSSIPLGDGLCQ